MPTDFSKWEHKELWVRRGKNFTVEISRHRINRSGSYDGQHGWCVYAYIFPEHPHFSRFSGPDMWQEAASVLPMHGGPTYLKYHESSGKVTCVQTGCDYNHLHDDRFTYMDTPEKAYSVFTDADDLYDTLAAMQEN